jgi:hypothetical protein
MKVAMNDTKPDRETENIHFTNWTSLELYINVSASSQYQFSKSSNSQMRKRCSFVLPDLHVNLNVALQRDLQMFTDI